MIALRNSRRCSKRPGRYRTFEELQRGYKGMHRSIDPRKGAVMKPIRTQNLIAAALVGATALLTSSSFTVAHAQSVESNPYMGAPVTLVKAPNGWQLRAGGVGHTFTERLWKRSIGQRRTINRSVVSAGEKIPQ